MKHPILMIISIIIFLLILFITVQMAIIRFNGTAVAIPTIPRGIQVSGSGEPLAYAIMGDSTSISQGSDYSEGFAAASTNYLATKYAVSALNTGISGAVAAEVQQNQLDEVVRFKPDIVLLAVGANDTTHFTAAKDLDESMQSIIDALKVSNPAVQIIVTASPALDSVTRFPAGSRQLMGVRTKQVNAVFNKLIDKNDLILAPIADKTRDAFIADPTLTASDNFHPNARGYALWIPVVNAAIDEAVRRRSL
jgi:acyl-CoA thioesterase-1